MRGLSNANAAKADRRKNAKGGPALRRAPFVLSDLLFEVFVFDPDGFLNVSNGNSGVVQLSRVQRDILTDRSTNAVVVHKAHQVVLMVAGLTAATVTLNLLQDFRNVLRDLIRFPGFPGEHRRG